MDLDFDIGDIVFFKNLSALEGRDNPITGRERSGGHADPEDDRGDMNERDEILFDVPDAEDVDASSLHVRRAQKGDDLVRQVASPGLSDRAVADRAKLLELLVSLWAGGRLPPGGAGASDQDWPIGGQAGVV